MKRLLITAMASLCLLAATAGGASASQIFGMNATPDLAASQLLPGQMQLMRQSGVQTMRVDFNWANAEPSPGHFDWTDTDAIVAAAASAHVSLLPIVEFTPPWASSAPDPAHDWVQAFAPRNPKTFGRFMTALIGRYGPNGSFWKQNPSLPKIPIRAWQIWNEPASTNYDWRSQPWWKKYPPMLKAAYIAAHKADPGVKIVTGALVALSCNYCVPDVAARRFYQNGWGGYFDVMAENVFAVANRAPIVPNTLHWLETAYIKSLRDVMNSQGDGRKPIWITELTWPATRSYQTPSSNTSCNLGFEVTTAEQEKLLTGFYTGIATKHFDGVQRAYWFDWASPYQATDPTNCSFEYTGLTQSSLNWSTPPIPMPILGTYSQVARKYAIR